MPPERPRRTIRPVVAWVVAATVAVGAASWGVGLVSRSVTDDRPAPLEAAQIEARLEQATSSSTTAAGPSTTAGEGSTTTTAPAGPPTTTARGGAPAPTTTAAPAPPATTPAAPTTTAAAETRTYSLVGGTASLRFSAGGVTLVFANPAPGFDVEVEPEHVNGLKVEFESETHRSRVDGWWDGGPQDRVQEDAGDG